MSELTDRDYLLTDQYKNASNLNARIQLHRRFSTNHYGWMLWIFDRLEPPPACRILEVGCGPGDLWRDNAGRIPHGWEITLSDFSPGMLQQARDKLAHPRRRFRFQTVDAQAIPYSDETFDAVIANHMLYHVPRRAQALVEMQRVLRPGGRLYAATIGREHLREIHQWVRTIDPHVGSISAADGFGLENGSHQLAPLFAHVSLHRYEDALVVTEVEPLLAYILSGFWTAPSDEQRERLARLIEDKMAAHGAVHITKDSGMFEAVKCTGH